jgi:AraC-like DNA-binding protein
LHLAIRLPRGSYGLLEYIGRSAATVRDAGERFLRYSALLNDTVTFTFVRHPDGTTATITQRVPGRPACVGRHAGEMFAALLVRYLREISGTDFQPVAIGFAHDKPTNTSELEAFFRSPIAFGCGENRVVLPLNVLELPLLGADPMLHSILEEQADRLLVSVRDREKKDRAKKATTPATDVTPDLPDPESDRLAKIRERIRLALEDGQPQLEDVAAALNMSPRTLQRRLGDAKTTFLELVDDVRHGLALAYIANPRFALGEVAYLLGFSEISAFTRAFKRWTGMTPSRWRARSNDLA